MIFSYEYFLLMFIAMALGFATQSYIKSTFRKWGTVPLESGLTGEQVARRVLDAEGLHQVEVSGIRGELTDHYDPRTRSIALSDPVFSQQTVAAAGVAAHEAGHAIQHARAYVPATIRTALVPAVNIGSSAAGILIMMGLFINMSGLLWLGIIAYSSAVLFQVVTLPVEIDASRRAMARLQQGAMMGPQQLAGARKVLFAAALTYVAAALVSIMYLVYYLGLARRN